MEDFQKTPHFLWQPANWLHVTGEDALTFLQGQFTNDLRNLIPKQATYGLWLTQKGKVLADSFVIRTGEEAFYVGSYACSAAVIRERLEAYIIADEVEIEDVTGEWRGLTLFTEAARDEIATLLPEGVVFRGRRGTQKHWEVVGPVEAMEKLVARLDSEALLSAEEMELRRIEGGVPAIPQDVGSNDLPNEGGLDRDAVSYEKGCYLGQEVMARLKAMGQVRRRVYQVSGEGEAPELPATLFAGDRKAGELRSTVRTANGFVGLAMITTMHLPDDKKLALEPGGVGMISVSEPV